MAVLFVARPKIFFFYSNLIKDYKENYEKKGDVAGEFYDTFEVGAAYRVFYLQLVSVKLLRFLWLNHVFEDLFIMKNCDLPQYESTNYNWSFHLNIF